MSARSKESMDILVTGGNGFLGNHIVQYLRNESHSVHTLGRTDKADIVCSIDEQLPQFSHPRYDVIIHAAGKAHTIPRSAEESEAFFKVNLNGTSNLCKALEQTGKLPQSFIFVSTVAVYGRETGELINEDHPLQGNTPYAQSKIQAEAFLAEWCSKNNVSLSILRLPLVVGQNAPGNLRKMITAIRKRHFFYIGAYNPRKSMVAATDVAKVILHAVAVPGIYNLTDGTHPTIRALGQKIADDLKVHAPFILPVWPFRILSKVGDVFGSIIPFNTNTFQKITASLTFDDSRARKKLNWDPEPVLKLSLI